MKIVCIGDIHGRICWKQIIQSNTWDKVVFMGDYFDSHDSITATQQINNFKDILEYKKTNLGKVILLVGNHDQHYIKGIDEKYKGYQYQHADEIQELINNAMEIELLQMSYIYGDIVFTHAGITKTWARNNGIRLAHLEFDINRLFKLKPGAFSFTPGKANDINGDSYTQPPTWIRPWSLKKDKLDGFIFIVGHTVQEKLIIDPHESIICIDALGTSGEYLVIEDEKFYVKKVPIT